MGPQGTTSSPGTTLHASQYGEPTWARAGTSIWWNFEADDVAFYRLDALLCRPVSRSPQPTGWDFVPQVRLFRDGGLWGVAQAEPDDPDASIVFEHDPAHTWTIMVDAEIWNLTTEAVADLDYWAVARVSSPGVVEEVQLPDRDCTITFDDCTVTTATDGDFLIGTQDSAEERDWYLESTGFLTGIFKGGWTLIEPFGLPFPTVGQIGGVWSTIWHIARARQLSGAWWYSQDYTGTYEAPPDSEPPVSPGPAPGAQYPDQIPLCGWDLDWSGDGILASTAQTRSFGAAFSLRHSQILSFAGRLGDGVQDSAYDTEAELYAQLEPYLETEGTPASIVWGAETCTMLGLQFQPDEKATSWWVRNGHAGYTPDVDIVWLAPMPTNTIPDWGVYLDDTTSTSVADLVHSNIAKPENSDPGIEVLTVVGPGAGGGWVDVDFEARLAYEAQLDDDYPGWEVPGYRFVCYPTALWDPDGVDGAQSPLGGERGHYNGDPRFALKAFVRPAAFTAYFDPELEPASPPYPNLTGTPDGRRTFWPQ